MVDRDLGFSLWLDFVERDYLKNEFSALIKKGIINGATSNPAIFAAAITTSPAYKEQLASMKGQSGKAKYEALAIDDVRTAAQALRPLYDDDNDGYISIEVDPFLSNDTDGTIAEGRRLFEAIGEPNVMVKVPATEAGYAAMTELLKEGISVNSTLIFSPDQAQKSLDAICAGIDESSDKTHAVISVFVSRFDRLLDSELESKGIESAKVGCYNAAKIYNMTEEDPHPNIKTLFASTGVKGDTLPPDYYIRELLASHSINTAPLATIESYIKTTALPAKLPIAPKVIDAYFAKVAAVGIVMEDVYDSLLNDGLEAFETAFQEMLKSIE